VSHLRDVRVADRPRHGLACVTGRVHADEQVLDLTWLWFMCVRLAIAALSDDWRARAVTAAEPGEAALRTYS